MTLESMGYAVGDLVTYSSDRESTGGIVFQIVENGEPIEPAFRSIKVMDNGPYIENGRYVTGPYLKTVHGYFDKDEKPIAPMLVHGYVRLRPLFSFFPTERGKKPKGKGETVLLYHCSVKEEIKKVDVVTLATKYAELGNVIRELAVKHGMVPQPSQEA